MKRALLLLALLLVPMVAHADLLVIRPGAAGNLGGFDMNYEADIVEYVLNSCGIQHTTIPTTAALAESLRFGSANVYSKTWKRFPAVIHCGFYRNVYPSGAYRPDSMIMISGKCPFVPQLFYAGQGFSNGLTLAGVDSTGALNSVQANAAGYNSDLGALAWVPGTPWVWRSFNQDSYKIDYTTPGGLRNLVAYNACGWTQSPLPADPDFMNKVANPDTSACWMRLFKNSDGTSMVKTYSGTNFPIAPEIFCVGAGGGGGRNVILTNLMVALAQLDSLTGGKVFAGATRLPRPMAMGIYATAFDTFGNDLTPADTVNFKASVDSLNSWERLSAFPAPIAVAVRAESTSTTDFFYRKLNAMPWAYFALGDCGTTVSAVRPGNCSSTNPFDPFGATRNVSAFTTLPWTGACPAADTCIACKIKDGLGIIGATYGYNRVSHVAFPQDWTPGITSTVTGVGGTMGIDSLVSAMTTGGLIGVVTVSRNDPSDMQEAETATTTGSYYAARTDLYVRPSGTTISGSASDLPSPGARLRVLLCPTNNTRYFIDGWLAHSTATFAPRYNPGVQYQSGSGVDLFAQTTHAIANVATAAGQGDITSDWHEYKWMIGMMNAVNGMCWKTNRPWRITTLDQLCGYPVSYSH